MTSTTFRFTSAIAFVAALVAGCDPTSPDVTEKLPYHLCEMMFRLLAQRG